jgi:hypothetical protein
MHLGWIPCSTAGKQNTHFSDTRVVWLYKIYKYRQASKQTR